MYCHQKIVLHAKSLWLMVCIRFINTIHNLINKFLNIKNVFSNKKIVIGV